MRKITCLRIERIFQPLALTIFESTDALSPNSDPTVDITHYRVINLRTIDIWNENPDNYKTTFPRSLSDPSTPAMPLSPNTFSLKFSTYTNRNIILYLLQRGFIDIPNGAGAKFFRNHKAADYKIFNINNVVLDTDGKNWF